MGAPSYFSRYRFCTGIPDGQGRVYLSTPEPFSYVELSDNKTHVTTSTDTWESLADRYFGSLAEQLALIDMEPSHLGWVIADFQPEPQPDCAFDPTLRIPAGLRLVIPSVSTVLERVFNEKRRIAHEA